MMEKDFFISTVNLIDIDGHTNIPTVLYYREGKPPLFGPFATQEETARFNLNEDFKLDLGNVDPSKISPKEKFDTASGEKKSALQLASDFMREIFKYIKNWLEENEKAPPKNMLIAEPLSLQEEAASPEWLTKYRNNLKRILSGQFFGLESISFLPEPFAVFQYYRYGHKHPILAQQAKHNALVIDFGGGTFDVCIIETTREGDIKIGGKHSKPLGASSVPIGGYYINRMIAEHLIFKYSKPNTPKKRIRSALKTYWDWRKDVIDFSPLSTEFTNFMRNFHHLIYEVENAKITLSKNISNWDLENCPNESVPVSIPFDPFSDESDNINGTINSKEFLNIFLNQVWKNHLKANIQRALDRGKEELKGTRISVALLSGGSANIGWLRELILKDFEVELEGVEIFPLPNFQEVVSNGLAIECARRYFTKDRQGDFSNITYNRICLVMNPDDYGFHVRSFRPRTLGLPQVQDNPGVLLPSASILKKFIDKPMRWRVKLATRPNKSLQYKFLRSSLDPNDTENILNVIDPKVFTPHGIKSDSEIQVSLLVKENGTAYPTFIYKTGPNDEIIESVPGEPFPIDLTYSQESVAEAYLGFDFGSSNSSISFVDESSIKTYIKRSTEDGWKELSDLVEILPYPLACHLASYLKQTGPDNLVTEARDFIEAALALASYISYCEYCSRPIKASKKIFKNFLQRSAGPLWKLAQETLKKSRKKAKFCKEFALMLSDQYFDIIDKAVTEISQHKHGKIDASDINTVRPVQIIANISQKVFTKFHFGYFENVHKQKFSKEYTGKFRIAHGRLPFYKALEYKGLISFSDDEAVIIDSKNGEALSLQPLVFWDSCEKHRDIPEGHCFFFDKYDDNSNSYSYKATGINCTCTVSIENKYRILANQIDQLRKEDSNMDLLSLDLSGEMFFE